MTESARNTGPGLPDKDAHPVSGERILWTLDEQLTPRGCALLVIDLQNDFIGEHGLLARSGRDTRGLRKVIPRVNALVRAARETGVAVFWVRTSHSHHDSRPNYLSVYVRDAGADRWNPARLLVLEGSQGAAWHPDLPLRAADEPEITKHAYSAFRDTALKQLLMARGIHSLVLTGVNTNVCILATVIDAFHEGYYPIICEDASATSSETMHQSSLETHRTFYGLTADAENIMRAWRRTPARRAAIG